MPTTNLATNPSFEGVTSGVTLFDVTAHDAVVEQSATWANTGSNSAVIVPSVIGSNDSYLSPGGVAGALRLNMLTGRSYTIKAVAHLESAQTGTLHEYARKIVATTVDPINGTLESASHAATNAPGDYPLALTFNIPIGATEAWIRLYNGAEQDGGSVWWDSLLVVQSPSPTVPYTGSYFDGGTANTTLFTHSWLGATDKSASQRDYADLPETDIPEPYGRVFANNSKGNMTITYRSGWLG